MERELCEKLGTQLCNELEIQMKRGMWMMRFFFFFFKGGCEWWVWIIFFSQLVRCFFQLDLGILMHFLGTPFATYLRSISALGVISYYPKNGSENSPRKAFGSRNLLTSFLTGAKGQDGRELKVEHQKELFLVFAYSCSSKSAGQEMVWWCFFPGKTEWKTIAFGEAPKECWWSNRLLSLVEG